MSIAPKTNPGLSTAAVSVVFLFVGLIVNLDSVPPLWWDEGWTLSVARNWLELGHYGRLLDGEPAPGGLEAGFPVTLSVAVSFYLLGVGIYQARLVAVVFTLATLALLYYLACCFYNRSIAVATLAVLFFMSSHVDLHPLIVGRQVLGEVPAIFFLLAGYTCFIWTGEKSLWFMPAAVFFWSVALVTKAQVQPFWVASLLTPFVLVLFQRNWKLAVLLGTSLICSLLLSAGWHHLIFQIQSIPRSPISGLARAVAMVSDGHVRVLVLMETIEFGLPTIFGICWNLWNFLRAGIKLHSFIAVGRLAVFVLAASWFAWFETLSIGWPRYLFPAALLGSMFVAVMLYEWTDHFRCRSTFERACLTLRRPTRKGVGSLAALIIIAISVGGMLRTLYDSYVINPDNSLIEAVQFLNTNTPPEALIETYESELFLFLDRRYHYPPDQVHVDLIRRNSLKQQVTIDYDALAADPDYLVIGPQSRFWEFYNPYLKSGAFRLLHAYSRYEIYERVR